MLSEFSLQLRFNQAYKIQLKIIQPRGVYIYIIGGKKHQNGRFVSSSNLAKLYSHQYCLSNPLDPFYILTCYIKLVKTSWTHNIITS